MHFGRNLHRNRIPEWASSYIDYYGLKKHIKLATKQAFAENQTKPEVDLTGKCQLTVTQLPLISNRI